jgi:hypothetical protein
VRNACLCLQERENHLGKIIIPKNHWKTRFKSLTFVQSSPVLIKGLSFD